uniref:Cytochrome P450 4c3 n=1 Tax=Cacopsylla melanoneura TaxID=428564 RepID=A0A8D9AZ38_9HEMI
MMSGRYQIWDNFGSHISLFKLDTLINTLLCTKLLLFVILLCVCVYHWRRRKLYVLSWKSDGPWGLPLIGNNFMLTSSRAEIFNNIQDLHVKYRSKGSKHFKLWIGPDLHVALLDIKTITGVLNERLKKGKNYHLMDEFIHSGIFVNSNIPQWRASRKTITSVFSFAVLKRYVRIFHSVALILVSKWQQRAESGASFNPEEDINLATFDMVMVNTLGLNPKAQQNPEDQAFMHHVEKIFEITMTRMFNIHLYSDFIFRLSGLRAQSKFSMNYLIDSAKNSLNVIRDKREENFEKPEISEKLGNGSLKKNNSARDLIQGFFGNGSLKKNSSARDLIQGVVVPEVVEEAPAKSFAELLMEDPNYSEENDSELISQMITIIGAGQDTTKTQNMVTLIMLALHPDVQDKVQDELDHILGPDPNSCPSYEDIAKLDYMEMVIKESLRMFPAAPFMGRSVDEDYDLGYGLILPAGAQVFVSIYSLHRDPAFYPHPDSFDPTRWTPEAVAQRPANCFIPFSTGARNCIGAKYAMLAMKTFLADVLRSYRILPTQECASMDDVGFDIQMTIKMNDNCKIRLKKRYTGEIHA